MVKDFNRDFTLTDIFGSLLFFSERALILSDDFTIGNIAESSILAMIATISVTILLLNPGHFLWP